MATNRDFQRGDQLPQTLAGVSSNDPVVVGQLPGVALTNTDIYGIASVQHDGVFELTVKGIDGSGNAAVVVGDILCFTAGDTPPLSKKATGVRFGYALGAVASGATGTIPVKLGY